MPERIFAVKADGGVKLLGDQAAALQAWPDGTPLELRKRKSQRTLAQNRTIWGLIYPQLAEALGYDKDEIEDLHYGLWAKYAGTHWDERVGAIVLNRRSSKTDTKDFADYIDWLGRFAAKHCGLVLTLPDEDAA